MMAALAMLHCGRAGATLRSGVSAGVPGPADAPRAGAGATQAVIPGPAGAPFDAAQLRRTIARLFIASTKTLEGL